MIDESPGRVIEWSRLEAMSRDELISTLRGAMDSIARLEESEKKGREHQQELEQLTYKLRERVKELRCLYAISSMVELGLSLEEIIRAAVDIIPDAWQYPEVTCSRIIFGGREYRTADFRETEWVQHQPINVGGAKAGLIEVCYLEERPEQDEGPFLAEERSLIKAIAERLGDIIERKRAEEAAQESEAKNRALLEAIPDLMFQMDGQGTLLGLHEGKFRDVRPYIRKTLGKSVYLIAEESGIIPTRVIDQAMAYVRRALETGKTQVFEQHISFEKGGRDLEVRIVVSRKNEVLGIVRDVTLRKRLEKEILEISGREQRRIGRDLHDSLCQHLTGVGFMGKVLERKIEGGLPLTSSDAAEIVGLIEQAIVLTRGFARGLNPVWLEAEGLMMALTELAGHAERLFGIKCRFEYDRPILVHDNNIATNLYRIVQEALNNAIKHGKADTVVIGLRTGRRNHLLTVQDNGVGLAATAHQGKGMGLNIMNYRASIIGATIDIRDRKEGGTVLTCSFPLKGDK